MYKHLQSFDNRRIVISWSPTRQRVYWILVRSPSAKWISKNNFSFSIIHRKIERKRIWLTRNPGGENHEVIGTSKAYYHQWLWLLRYHRQGMRNEPQNCSAVIFIGPLLLVRQRNSTNLFASKTSRILLSGTILGVFYIFKVVPRAFCSKGIVLFITQSRLLNLLSLILGQEGL